jgi:hypothetical protein
LIYKPEFRGCGVNGLVLEALTTWIKSQGISEIRHANGEQPVELDQCIYRASKRSGIEDSTLFRKRFF